MVAAIKYAPLPFPFDPKFDLVGVPLLRAVGAWMAEETEAMQGPTFGFGTVAGRV